MLFLLCSWLRLSRVSLMETQPISPQVLLRCPDCCHHHLGMCFASISLALCCWACPAWAKRSLRCPSALLPLRCDFPPKLMLLQVFFWCLIASMTVSHSLALVLLVLVSVMTWTLELKLALQLLSLWRVRLTASADAWMLARCLDFSLHRCSLIVCPDECLNKFWIFFPAVPLFANLYYVYSSQHIR